MDDQELMDLARDYGVDMSDYDDSYPDPHSDNISQPQPNNTRYSGHYDFEAFDDEPGEWCVSLAF